MTRLLDQDDSDLIGMLKRRYQEGDSYTDTWRKEARELYAMVAGDQWDEVDRLRMLEQLRPAVTFNITGKFIDAIGGLQITNRQEVKYLPREPGDSGVNELMTGAADWVRDEADAEDEESEGFLDMLTCGMGWVEMELNFDENPEGDISVERRDPLEMFWDPRARRRNIRDTRWRMRIKRMTKEDIIDRWGEEEYDNITGQMGIEPEITDDEVHHATEAWKYEHEPFDISVDRTVPVIHFESWERTDAVSVKTQYGTKTFTTPQWRKMKQVLEQNGVQYQATRTKGREFTRIFAAGEHILEKGLSPYQQGFTWQCMTGKRDRNKNTWYGIGRGLKDPQQWTNKLFSTILYTMSTGSKGGLMAEEGAFADPARAEDEWSRPDAITWLEDGALAEGKIKEKEPAKYPAGLDRLMQFALTSVPEVSGINLELIGLTNKVQAGVVEAQRKDAAMTVIAWAFDALRRYYKDHGRMLAYYIREYISDGRLARITTAQGQQYIPLVKEELTLEFDVVVDEAPKAANVKDRVWGVLQLMLPHMLKMGVPIPPEILDYSPLPTDLAEKWKEKLKPDPQQQQAQQQEKAMSDKERTTEIGKDESITDLNRAKERKTLAEAGKTAAGG